MDDEVSIAEWDTFLADLEPALLFDVNNFTAGQIQNHAMYWRELTSDPWILNAIEGCDIEFDDTPDIVAPREILFSQEEMIFIDEELDRLWGKNIIVPSTHCPGECISPIFVRPKKDGSHRLILNLKSLNQSIVYRHFKMDTLQSAINLMTPNCYMASLDWKDAYYSVPVDPEFQKYLKFRWRGSLYQFTCLAQGLSPAPRLFTKLSKPIYSHLRKMGHMNSAFIDDSFLMGDSLADARRNVMDSVRVIRSAGFVIHPIKSVFHPTQVLTYLGFILNSVDMTVKITPERASRLQEAAKRIYDSDFVTIRQVAEAVGMMVSSFPGVTHGPLFYRLIDNEKSAALAANKGNFDACMTLTPEAKADVHWWIKNIKLTTNPIQHDNPCLTLRSDASNVGWGGVCNRQMTGGNWSPLERKLHINILELKAASFTLQSFCKDYRNCHIRLQLDNTTAVAYINHMGGTKARCNAVAREMWLWCLQRNLLISATHLPGVSNVDADAQSRMVHENTEWQLNPGVFHNLVSMWGNPEVDLFASRLNHQVAAYVAWKPDPEAVAIDALSIQWDYRLAYAFPPFSLIGLVLRKIELEHCEAIVVVPYWTTQPWFSKLMRMLTDCPFVLPRKDLLTHPTLPEHNLPKMNLVACRVSGDSCKTKDFLQQLRISSCHHGQQEQRCSTERTSNNGLTTVVKGTLIKFHQLQCR